MAAKTLSEFIKIHQLGDKGIRIAIAAWEDATDAAIEKFKQIKLKNADSCMCRHFRHLTTKSL